MWDIIRWFLGAWGGFEIGGLKLQFRERKSPVHITFKIFIAEHQIF